MFSKYSGIDKESVTNKCLYLTKDCKKSQTTPSQCVNCHKNRPIPKPNKYLTKPTVLSSKSHEYKPNSNKQHLPIDKLALLVKLHKTNLQIDPLTIG